MKKFPICLVSTAILFTPALRAAIIVTDPALFTGEGAIDPVGPTGYKDVIFTPSNATPQAVLEGRADFAAIQDFGGFGTANQSASQKYIFNNTSLLLPDIQVAYTGSLSSSGAATAANSGFTTSDGAGMRLAGAAGGTSGFTLSFGDWNGTDLIPLASGGIAAAGFTLTGRYGMVSTVTVNYLDAGGNVLNSQSISTSIASGTTPAAAYTGYQIQDGQNPIARIELNIVSPEESGALFLIDDLGFSQVPEASSGLLVLGSAVVSLFSRRRRA